MEKKAEKTEQRAVKTAADKIWDEIKDIKLEMFALPDQFVHNYCTPVSLDPNKLYMKVTASAVLPALETVLHGKYTVEQVDKYICVHVPVKPF